jgi:hypothetical protein
VVADWYCEIDGEQQGPMTAGDLKQLVSSGKLQPGHLIWKEGMQKKAPARSVKGLFGGPSQTPAPAGAQRSTAGATAAPPQKQPGAKKLPASRPSKENADIVDIEPIDDMDDAEVIEGDVEEVIEDVEEVIEDVEEVVEDVEEVVEEEESKPAGKKPVNRDRKQAAAERTEEGKPPPRQSQKTGNKTAAGQAAPGPAKPNAAAKRPAPANKPATKLPAKTTGLARAASTGKPFRVLSSGKILGPYSLEDIRSFLDSGQLEAGDLIGVETWLPVATLSGLLLSGSAKGSGAAGTSAEPAAAGDKAVEDEELEEIEVHEVDDDAGKSSKDKAPPVAEEDEKIRMDAEFNIE